MCQAMIQQSSNITRNRIQGFVYPPDRCSTGTEGQALFCNDDALSFGSNTRRVDRDKVITMGLSSHKKEAMYPPKKQPMGN